jgi:hypothetical protein
MGQVTPLRAHSLRLALAEALSPADPPALLVACATSSLVALGEDREAFGEVDPTAREIRRLPLLRLPGSAPAHLISEGDLLLWLVLPGECAAQLNLPAVDEGRQAWLASLLAAVGGPEFDPGQITVDSAAGGVVLGACLSFELDPGGAEGRPVRSPAEVGEWFLQLLEQRTGLELVPSMPLPEELDAVYEWDARLAAAADRQGAPKLAQPVA